MASLLSNTPLAQHMGQLHAYENFLVIAIAFGPFLVLGVVVFFIRRRDLAEEDQPSGDAVQSEPEQSEPEPGISPDRPPAT